MTQLFIDGREVALPTGFSFVLTEENPYFTQAGQFSDEIEIPLSGININIFGHLNRRDITIKGKTYDARIVVNNHAIVVGTATVTSVNNDSISLQILGNNSDVNYLSQFGSIYIDDMDLGYACAGITGKYVTTRSRVDTTHEYVWDKKKVIIREYVDGTLTSEKYSTSDEIEGFSSCANYYSDNEKVSNLYNSCDNRNFVCLPATDKGSNISVNSICHYIDRNYTWDNKNDLNFLLPKNLYYKDNDSTTVEPQWDESALSDYTEAKDNHIVPQPYLVYVIERFVEELGYTLVSSDIRSNWLKNAYLVNTTNTSLIQNMLPHWTATQFMTEVEHLLGVVFWFNSRTKSCSIIHRDSAFSTNLDKSQIVGDVFSIDVDEDSTTDISNANVVIDYGEDLLHHFDESIRNNSTEVECDGISGVQTLFSGTEAPDGTPVVSCVALRRSSTNTKEKCRKYILKDNVVTACDQMGDLIRGKNNEEIELGIQPASVTTFESYVIYPRHSTNAGTKYLVYLNPIPILQRCPVSPAVPQKNGLINIGKYIEGDDEVVSNTFDKLYISLYSGINVYNGTYGGDGKHLEALNIKEYMGWVWQNDDLTGLHYQDHTETLQLRGDTSLATLSDNWNGINIDTTRKYTLTIYVETTIDVRKVYVIEGKRYVCESVKYTINENGFSKSAECVMYKFLE